MEESKRKPGGRTLTESDVTAALQIDRLELHLVAAEMRLGRYDSMTHLLAFTPGEVQRIAARLELPPPKFAEETPPTNDRAVNDVPEPEGE